MFRAYWFVNLYLSGYCNSIRICKCGFSLLLLCLGSLC